MKVFRGKFTQPISKDKLISANKIIGCTWIINDTIDGFRDMWTLSRVWESQGPGKSTNSSFWDCPVRKKKCFLLFFRQVFFFFLHCLYLPLPPPNTHNLHPQSRREIVVSSSTSTNFPDVVIKELTGKVQYLLWNEIVTLKRVLDSSVIR